MKEFQDLVPADMKSSSLPTSWDDVEAAVATVQARWETKGKDGHVTRAKGWVRKMCNGLHNHSTALKMLPSESEYVSLVAGAVTMIIKVWRPASVPGHWNPRLRRLILCQASANYTNITESFAKGIVDINDAVSLAEKSQVYHTSALRQLTMRLYSQVFAYLYKFMRWYSDRSRSRFLKSFNENIHRTFEEDLAKVRKISHLLSEQINLHMSADVRVSKLLEEDTNSDVKYLIKLNEAETRRSQLREAATADLLEDILHRQLSQSKEEIEESLQGMMARYEERMRRELSGAAITSLLKQTASHEGTATPKLLEFHQISGKAIYHAQIPIRVYRPVF